MRVIIYLGLLFALAACRNRNGGLESEAASVQSSQQSIAFIRSFVESKLRQQGREPSELFSFEGHCLDYSALWIKIFSDSGIKVALQQTSGVYYPKVNGKSVQRTPTHFFLAVNPDSADEIIIDPTYGQFFAEAERLDLRPVLVATKEEVFAVYSRNARSLRMNVFGDEHTGEYDSRDVAEMLYSLGSHAKNRTNMGY